MKQIVNTLLIFIAIFVPVFVQSMDKNKTAPASAVKDKNKLHPRPRQTQSKFSDISYESLDGAIIDASENQNIPLLEQLLREAKRRGVLKQIIETPDENGGGNLLMGKVARNHAHILDILLAENPNVNYQNDAGVTPLLNAIPDQNEEVVQRLIAAKADVNLASYVDKYAPLTVAANLNTSITRCLVDANADVNHAMMNGRTALMNAVLTKTFDVERVNLLLDAKADPFQQDKDKKTALQYAYDCHAVEPSQDRVDIINGMTGRTALINAVLAEKFDFKHVKSLLEAKADPAQKDVFGKSALHYLRERYCKQRSQEPLNEQANDMLNIIYMMKLKDYRVLKNPDSSAAVKTVVTADEERKLARQARHQERLHVFLALQQIVEKLEQQEERRLVTTDEGIVEE